MDLRDQGRTGVAHQLRIAEPSDRSLPSRLPGPAFSGRAFRVGYCRVPGHQFGKGQQIPRVTGAQRLQDMIRDRICISTWSFHTLFESGEMQLLQFPEMVVDRYGVHNIEVVAPHAASTTHTYFLELCEALDRAGVRIVNI